MIIILSPPKILMAPFSSIPEKKKKNELSFLYLVCLVGMLARQELKKKSHNNTPLSNYAMAVFA